jgi:hypothetical protein
MEGRRVEKKYWFGCESIAHVVYVIIVSLFMICLLFGFGGALMWYQVIGEGTTLPFEVWGAVLGGLFVLEVVTVCVFECTRKIEPFNREKAFVQQQTEFQRRQAWLGEHRYPCPCSNSGCAGKWASDEDVPGCHRVLGALENI